MFFQLTDSFSQMFIGVKTSSSSLYKNYFHAWVNHVLQELSLFSVP